MTARANTQGPSLTVDDLVNTFVSIFPSRRPNDRQRACIAHDPNVPLMIVAGPGTGKTSVLVMRALRHLLVDRILPEHILITTFTKKAAAEIRTRLIEWGEPLIARLKSSTTNAAFRRYLDSIDINRFLTGTLDSICEDALSISREATERPPVVVEPFAANQILSRYGQIREEMAAHGPALGAYLHRYSSTEYPPNSVAEVTRVVRILIDRFVQDRVDIDAYAANGQDMEAKAAILRIFARYSAELRESNRMDFPALERSVFDRVVAGQIPEGLSGLRAMLIDEYQDTNPLQESLYFALAAAADTAVTVVGDDDQSLYRFRGATIELFRDFSGRVRQALGIDDVRTLVLLENYRSLPAIVTFFNDFITNDPAFAAARVQPPKDRIIETRAASELPVLGLFRNTVEDLAVDLGAFLHQVFRGGGWTSAELPGVRIQGDPDGGDFGDAVMIGHSAAEYGNEVRGNRPERLPLLLRRSLAERGVPVFNPRGQALADVPAVQTLMGLVLECLDPSSAAAPQGRSADLFLTTDARRSFAAWRAAAAQFTAGPVFGKRFESRLEQWRAIVSTGNGGGTAREWPVLDLIYGFIPWLPEFQDDPEHQVYLEAISRCAAEAATFSTYRATIQADNEFRLRSVNSLIYDVLVPIADGLVDPDEDIMPSVPRDHFTIMTVHQAKGLEFPLVVVDVSSKFSMNHARQKFLRYPEEPSSVALLEDDLAHCTEIGPARRERDGLARSFDDLMRLYYVAYSRPQSALLLVGHYATLKYNGAPRNVASFWRQDGSWGWRDELTAAQLIPRPGVRRARGAAARMPAVADRVPVTLI